jgi:hypothetical protein
VVDDIFLAFPVHAILVVNWLMKHNCTISLREGLQCATMLEIKPYAGRTLIATGVNPSTTEMLNL